MAFWEEAIKAETIEVWGQPLVEKMASSTSSSFSIFTIIPTRAGPAGSLGWSETGSPRLNLRVVFCCSRRVCYV